MPAKQRQALGSRKRASPRRCLPRHALCFNAGRTEQQNQGMGMLASAYVVRTRRGRRGGAGDSDLWNLRHDHMRASEKSGQASGFRRVDERKEAIRSGRMNGTDVDSAGSGTSIGESGAANLHLLYVVYSAVDSAGSGISVGEPGAANLHMN